MKNPLALISTVVALCFSTSPLSHAAPTQLSTIAEQTGFQKTGRYDEVIRLCARFQQSYPRQVRCEEFGRTPEGRPMLALIANNNGVLTTNEAKKRNLPVLLIQGGIHAGEIDGKDAGFLALREILDNKTAQGALSKQVLIFVPVFNIDGHERFGRWNRPNQVGPEEMGWRTTAQNLNLNRDYVKADAPEMQAMLGLVNAWDPLAYIDLHVTDGAKFQHDVSVQVFPAQVGSKEINPGQHNSLLKAGTHLRDNVLADLTALGSMPLPFYPSFAINDDPGSGFIDGVSPPRFSHGYFVLRNRFGMLVETHSWKDYPTRVRVTHNAIIAAINQLAQHGAEWKKIAQDADLDACKLGGQSVIMSYKAAKASHLIRFQGYAYTRAHSDVSGALMTHYDDTKPQTWEVPMRDQLEVDLSIIAPKGGYVVPAAEAGWVGQKLSQHGISFRVIAHPFSQVEFEAFRADKATFSAASFEGHQILQLQGQWQNEKRSIGSGAIFVPIAQPKARLVMTLLEPQSVDSLAAWGKFNNAFEMKEYMEEYVAEDVARAQLAADPQLAAEFKNKLDTDPEFAKNSFARLQFFARRHPSWDERFNLYPVLRTASVPN